MLELVDGKPFYINMTIQVFGGDTAGWWTMNRYLYLYTRNAPKGLPPRLHTRDHCRGVKSLQEKPAFIALGYWTHLSIVALRKLIAKGEAGGKYTDSDVFKFPEWHVSRATSLQVQVCSCTDYFSSMSLSPYTTLRFP